MLIPHGLFFFFRIRRGKINFAGMAELADAMDLGSIGLPVQVRPLLPAP